MSELAFGLSVAVAHAATNLDNLVVLLTLVAAGVRPAPAGYLLAQGFALVLALVLGSGAALAGTDLVRWLGLVPIGLGIRAYRMQSDAPLHTRPESSLAAATLLFAGLSVDTLAVMAPLLADSAPGFRRAARVGGILSALTLCGLGAILARSSKGPGPLARLDRVAPLVMIASGFYVILNTATDLD